MALWLLIVRPFLTKSNLYINASNELILILILFILYLLETNDKLVRYANEIGWLLISLVGLAILQSWIIMFPLMVKIIKRKCCGKKEKEEVEITK